MILIITYDLNNPTKDYNPFFDAIKKEGVWWHHLKNTWLVDTAHTPAQVWANLSPFVETSDRVMVAKMTAPYEGWLAKDAWDWLKARLPLS